MLARVLTEPGSGPRRDRRYDVAATALVASKRRVLGPLVVENLSASGALFSGDDGFRTGEIVRLVLFLPCERQLTLFGRVVRHHNASSKPAFAVAFRFPAERERTEREALLSVLRSLLALAPPTVLVVDDSPEVRRALARDFEALGYRVLCAATPLEAVDLLVEPGEQIDAAVVDYFLGGSEGLEILDYLAEASPEVRRVLISGDPGFAELDLSGIGRRVDTVLSKPWSRAQLSDAVR